jgi:hypothetical protein
VTAAALTLLLVQTLTSSDAAPPMTWTSTSQLQSVDNGCQVARPGMPC